MAQTIMEMKLSQLMSVPKLLKKPIFARILLFLIILLIWVYINGVGNASDIINKIYSSTVFIYRTSNFKASVVQLLCNGLLPYFLRQRLPILRVGPEVNILYYFDAAKRDGSKIRWSRATNTQQKLQQALTGSYDMIEADVILKGQGTPRQALTPIISDLPIVDGEFTLKMWLQQVKKYTKGIKLDFRTIDAVEMSLQILKGMKEELKIPIWLQADILPGPFSNRLPVDSTRFLRNVRTLFPSCTLSLGWTTGSHTDVSQAGYTWDMVLDMHDLIRKWEITQPLVFSVRLSLVPNSIPQLKWLCDSTQASLLVWNDKEDQPVLQNIMYVAYRFPPEKSFFDFTDSYLQTHLTNYRHFSKEHVDALVLARDDVKFNPYAWVKMGLYIEENSILPSSESLVLKSPAVYIVSISKFRAVKTLDLKGRVHFLDRKKKEAVTGETGISIYLRSVSYSDYEKIGGIRCFIGVLGDIEISGRHLSKNIPEFTKSARITPGSANCYRFSVVDAGSEVIMEVNTLHDCDTLASVRAHDSPHLTVRVKIPHNVNTGQHPYIVKMEDSKRVAVIDELMVHHHAQKHPLPKKH